MFQNLGKINLVFFVLKCVSGWQVIFQDTLVFQVETFPAHIKTTHRLTKRQNNTEENTLGETLLKTIYTANKQTNKQTKDWAQNFRQPRYARKKVFCSDKTVFLSLASFQKSSSRQPICYSPYYHSAVKNVHPSSSARVGILLFISEGH